MLKPPPPSFFSPLAIYSFPSVMANRVSPVKSTTFSIGRLWKKVRSACCHVSHAKAPRHLFMPPGTQPPRTAGLFWRSAGWERADVGVHGGGWDYRWAVGGVGGCRTEWTWAGLLRQELLSTKGTSTRLNGQRPRTIRWTIMTLCWLQPQGTWSRVHARAYVYVCGVCVWCVSAGVSLSTLEE